MMEMNVLGTPALSEGNSINSSAAAAAAATKRVCEINLHTQTQGNIGLINPSSKVPPVS